jgi:hypothetical protein
VGRWAVVLTYGARQKVGEVIVMSSPGKVIANGRRRGVLALSALAALLCVLALGACGGGSKGASAAASRSSKAAATSAGVASVPSTAIAAGEAVLANYRACLMKYGVNLPAWKIGESIKQPKGVTRSQYAAARLKCSSMLGSISGSPEAGGSKRAQGRVRAPQVPPAVLARLVKFAACMRANGVSIPQPTASAPIVIPTEVVKTPGFRAAELKCSLAARK